MTLRGLKKKMPETIITFSYLKKLIKIFQTFSVVFYRRLNLYWNMINTPPQNTGETPPQHV
jgi:hypothetical protein